MTGAKEVTRSGMGVPGGLCLTRSHRVLCMCRKAHPFRSQDSSDERLLVSLPGVRGLSKLPPGSLAGPRPRCPPRKLLLGRSEAAATCLGAPGRAGSSVAKCLEILSRRPAPAASWPALRPGCRSHFSGSLGRGWGRGLLSGLRGWGHRGWEQLWGQH